ncbi:ribonuclease H1-like [Rhagoletis pomonella]|uniref:ribonuclease H1-like n=1 Tax=Rhagoletis pomonella TaxID=28610 RepID=UPI001780173D|nr:ribonuclease H1-like [Rhagoletis pomonella]
MPFYAVANGRKVGVYTSWAECEQQVKKFSGAIFKKFPSLSEATDYLIQQQANILHENLEKEAGCSAMASGFAMNIKQEEPEYIPLQTTDVLTPRIKQEPKGDGMWFEDAKGDDELLAALGALKEYPDKSLKTRATKIEKINIKKERDAKIQRLKVGNYVYNVDNDGYIDVYIGGHGENIGNWNCMAGYGVYFGENHPLNVAEAASGRMTRNVGDIEAAIAAIEAAERVGIPKLCLHSSSEFLLNAVAHWMHNWKRNGWRNKDGKVVQNRKQFEKLDKLLTESSIDIKWADARKEAGASKHMRGVKRLAAIGTEEYLDKHPSKDDSFSMDLDYFDFY